MCIKQKLAQLLCSIEETLMLPKQDKSPALTAQADCPSQANNNHVFIVSEVKAFPMSLSEIDRSFWLEGKINTKEMSSNRNWEYKISVQMINISQNN